MKSTKKEIGKRITKIRNELDMTKEQFARHIGITPQYLGTLESGENCFSIEKLIQFCKKVNISTDYLLLGKISFSDNYIKELLKEYTEEQVESELVTIRALVKLVKTRQAIS